MSRLQEAKDRVASLAMLQHGVDENGFSMYDRQRYLYEGLLPNDHPIIKQRLEDWKWLIEETDPQDSETGVFDVNASDDDFRHVQNWRRPSWRKRQLAVGLETQYRRNELVARRPNLLNEGSQVLQEVTTSSPDITAFTTRSLPMQRRIWPSVYYADLVPTLAWTLPNGKVHFVDYVFATSGESYAVDQRIDNNEDPDYTDDPGECTDVNEIDALITYDDITTEALKVLNKWSLEAGQDAMSQYGLDLESSLMMTDARLITRNKNRKIIEDLRTQGTAGTATFDKTIPAAAPWSSLDPAIYHRSMVNDVLDVSTDIFSKVGKKASWLVMDEVTENFLAQGNAFSIDPIGDMRGRTSVGTTPNLFGTMKGMFDVFVDRYLVEGQIIVGARPDTFEEAGYVVLEYVSLFQLPLWTDPDTQCNHRSVMERFGRHMVNGDYFGRVHVIET